MDAVSLTIKDHRTVEELFSRFESTDDPAEKRQIMDTVIEELSVHAAIEEQVLYPAMRQLPDGDDLVDEAIEEHVEAKVALVVLDRLQPDHPMFDEKATELIADVRHHVEEEESELLPRMKEHFDSARLEDLGRQLQEAKAGAPTQPAPADLAEATGEQLYEAAQVLDLDGRSDMKKDELVKLVAGS